MSAVTSTPINAGADKSTRSARLFFLDAGGGPVFSANADGYDLKTIINEGWKFPDGIVVDIAAGHIYWTNMGNPAVNDGSIERADFDGSNIRPEKAGEGGIFCANLETPERQTPANREYIELLYDGLPELIDLEIDLAVLLDPEGA